MKLAGHYYSMISGLAASLGSFFGKLISYSADGTVSVVKRMFHVSLLPLWCGEAMVMPYYIFFVSLGVQFEQNLAKFAL